MRCIYFQTGIPVVVWCIFIVRKASTLRVGLCGVWRDTYVPTNLLNPCQSVGDQQGCLMQTCMQLTLQWNVMTRWCKEIVALLERNGLSISKFTVYRAWRKLCYTSQEAAYCQLIRAPNCMKHLQWARENLGSSFEHVTWSDETTAQFETHRWFCCRKKGQNKPQPKHAIKLHIYVGWDKLARGNQS